MPYCTNQVTFSRGDKCCRDFVVASRMLTGSDKQDKQDDARLVQFIFNTDIFNSTNDQQFYSDRPTSEAA